MKTKKAIIAVLTAALITALIIGCIAPLDSSNIGVDKEQSVAEGITMVRLSFADSDSSARTLLPNTSGKSDASKFSWYKLVITNKAGNVDASPPPPTDSTHWTYAELTAPGNAIGLASGNYKFEVFATDDKTVNLAYGVVDNKAISGTDDSVSITLKEIIGTGVGTFAWNLDVLTNGYTFAELRLATIADPDTPVKTVNLLATSNSNDPAIASGYYRIVTELRKTNCLTVFVRETVHIYAGFTSTYDDTLPVLKSTVRVVNYDYGTDEPFAGRPTTENLAHGDVILTAITNKNPANILDSTDKVFDAWYYDSAATTKKVGNSDRIVETPLILYAKWKDKINPYTLTLDWSGVTYKFADNGSSATYNLATKDFDLTLKVSITDMDDNPVSPGGTIRWFVDFGGGTVELGDGATFTHQYNADTDLFAANWLVGGTFIINVELGTESGYFTLIPSPSP